MNQETCSTCKEWDTSIIGKHQNIEGLCERHGCATFWDYMCKEHKLKPTIKIQRLYYKIKWKVMDIIKY